MRWPALALSALLSCHGFHPAPGPSVPPAPGVAGPAWWSFGRDPQHTGIAASTQDLDRVAWSAPVDEAPQQTEGDLLIHYGSPVVTSLDTVVFPVKTGASGGFRIEARSGVNGGLIWSAQSDYLTPPYPDFVPSYNLALTGANRLYAPGAGGRLLERDAADSADGALTPIVFYGAASYAADPGGYDRTVFVNTPITVDPAGDVFFGFMVTGANAANLSGGIARIDASGAGNWIAASAAANDPAIDKPATNSAPALSNDLATLYVALNSESAQQGTLVALDSSTLAVKSRERLIDPASGLPAMVSDDSTASPTVAPDGDVYFGVLESRIDAHNGRGWLLHFDAALGTVKAPGGFGWDDTASVLPASLVPSYRGPSSYLLLTKYNNYLGLGSGDGLNRMAVLDPAAQQTDPISGVSVLREVSTILDPTPDPGSAGAVKEWCVNAAAVDAATGSVLMNNEDGVLYRWDLGANAFSQRLALTSGIGEAYTPVVIGADGTVYAISEARLFAVAR